MNQSKPSGERDELDRLRQQLDSVVAELRSVRGELDDLQRGDESVRPEIEIPAAVTRRNWMKGAAAAAVGGTALALGSSDRVAADDPNDLTLGTTKTTTALTVGGHDGAQTGGMAYLFETKSGYAGTFSGYPGALGGWSAKEDLPNGVYGYTEVNSDQANGVVGWAGNGRGTGVRARSDRGVGVCATGGFIGVSAEGGEYGVSANGDIAALLLGATNTTAPPDRVGGSGVSDGSFRRVRRRSRTTSRWRTQWGAVSSPSRRLLHRLRGVVDQLVGKRFDRCQCRAREARPRPAGQGLLRWRRLDRLRHRRHRLLPLTTTETDIGASPQERDRYRQLS